MNRSRDKQLQTKAHSTEKDIERRGIEKNKLEFGLKVPKFKKGYHTPEAIKFYPFIFKPVAIVAKIIQNYHLENIFLQKKPTLYAKKNNPSKCKFVSSFLV